MANVEDVAGWCIPATEDSFPAFDTWLPTDAFLKVPVYLEIKGHALRANLVLHGVILSYSHKRKIPICQATSAPMLGDVDGFYSPVPVSISSCIYIIVYWHLTWVTSCNDIWSWSDRSSAGVLSEDRSYSWIVLTLPSDSESHFETLWEMDYGPIVS